MKKVLLLIFFMGNLLTVYGQAHSLQWTLTPSLGVGYKLSDWLYGAPLCLGIQGQVIVKDKALLETWTHMTAFKDVVFKDRKFSKLFGNDWVVLHSLKVVATGIGYQTTILKKNHLQVSGGIAWVNYKEPFVSGPTGGFILPSYDVNYYTRNSMGLYGKIQYTIFLKDHFYLSLGSTALSCRSLSYGTIHTGLTFWFPHKSP